MPNANNYAKNTFGSYNKGTVNSSKQFFMNSADNTTSNSAGSSLSSPDQSGSVYINPSFNVHTEDPGISWVL